MAGAPENARPAPPQRERPGGIETILSGIRVPDLPYPAGRLRDSDVRDWRPLLASCWSEQRDERVTHVLHSVDLEWSVRQVNAAYVADRIMDVFLKTSGLHPELVRRVARLRFYLAWRMEQDGDEAFGTELIEWLDGLREWRGWSNSGGRSSRVLLEQLDGLVLAVSAAFEGEGKALGSFCLAWQDDSGKRRQQIERLCERLLETERGAASQRRADRRARALIGRALQGRRLPEPLVRFILGPWQRLLKQAAVTTAGGDQDALRRAGKLLEWLVWVGDPQLSEVDRNRLYHVGEQLGDRMLEVWHQVFDQPLAHDQLNEVETILVARLRGDALALVDAFGPPEPFHWEPAWLAPAQPDPAALAAAEGRWFVSGEGAREERRFFFAYLADCAEILWTNGAGVKLGVEPWQTFEDGQAQGRIRPLPPLTPFRQVLSDTTQILLGVCDRQQRQRQRAAEQGTARAEALRRERQAEEERRRREEDARQAELERQRREAEAQRLADARAEQERLERERRLAVERQVAAIKLGGWIALQDEGMPEPRRLKLAVRINASRKLVFVDRMGLNRRECLEADLVHWVLSGQARVLDSSAEFDDTLTRVVGRIRMGRNGDV